MSPLSQSGQNQSGQSQPNRQAVLDGGEEGFMLLAVVIMVALLLIALSAAAPVVARQLRREKEIESQHRMEQYVRAIQLYQRKFHQYPPSIKALENSNNVRFLRHVYVDPLTGKADYRLIHLGEQKTKIHVFFGQELGGLSAGLGAAAGMQASGGIGAPMGSSPTSTTSTIGATSALASGFSGASITTTGANGSTGASGASGSTGTDMFGDGTGGVIVGVGTSKTGDSITQPNGQTTYETWEFWYDPRIEMLKQSVNLTGGGVSSQSASSFGLNSAGQPNSGASGLGGIGAGSAGGLGGAMGSSGATSGTGSTGPTSPFSSPFSNPL